MKTDNQNEKLTGDNLPTESIAEVAMYNKDLQSFAHNSAKDIVDPTRDYAPNDVRQLVKQMILLGANWQKSQPDNRVSELEAKLKSSENIIEYYKNHFSIEKYNNGVFLQKNNDNRQWSAEQWIEEFYEFLKTGEAEKIQVTHKPMLSEDQAFTVIWYLQEHFPLLPDNIDQCDVCKQLYDSHSTGLYSENGNKHGHSFCGSCDYLAPYDDEDSE